MPMPTNTLAAIISSVVVAVLLACIAIVIFMRRRAVSARARYYCDEIPAKMSSDSRPDYFSRLGALPPLVIHLGKLPSEKQPITPVFDIGTTPSLPSNLTRPDLKRWSTGLSHISFFRSKSSSSSVPQVKEGVEPAVTVSPRPLPAIGGTKHEIKPPGQPGSPALQPIRYSKNFGSARDASSRVYILPLPPIPHRDLDSLPSEAATSLKPALSSASNAQKPL